MNFYTEVLTRFASMPGLKLRVAFEVPADNAQGTDHLSGFPDRMAATRYARIVVRYALQHSLELTRGFGNNWEHADYAFAASYVGRLATADNGLAQTVGAVFPYVEVLDQPWV